MIYYFLILPISWLPYAALYLFSDFLYVIVYPIFKYRKNVILTNIQNSFPEKSSDVQTKIMQQFYSHLCDLIVESIKGFTISEKELRERLVVRNPEVMNKFYDEGKDVIIIGGHFNNWEIGTQGIGFKAKHLPIGIYKALHDVYLDGKMKKSRERYRLLMVPTKDARLTFEADFGEPNAIVFGMDQSPCDINKGYWMTFLNQDASVSYGVEKYAKEFNRPIVHTAIHKIKRGHYEIELRLLIENPAELPYGQVIEICTKSIERDIVANPEFWLWSHRRWKGKRPEHLVQKEPLTVSTASGDEQALYQ